MKMIIDCHTHLNNYHNEEVDSLQECLEKLQQEMRRNRIDAALVLTSYKSTPGRPPTREVVDATRNLGNIFVVAGVSYLSYTENDVDELRAFLKERMIVGLKIYPGYEPFFPNDTRMTPVYEMAEEFDVPVMIHTGDTFSPQGKLKYSHPIHVDEVAVDYPDVKFIICHLGSPWFRDTMEVVYKNSNVFTDISGLVLGNFTDRFESYMSKQFQEMVIYGMEPDKVLFGTDWPISSMESYLEFMGDLSIPEKEKKKILFENAVRLFKLPVPTSPLKATSFFSH
jgi:predicted TIM-barrel fold metal-dependent hydrolase